jgi:hypothetical protein
MDVPIPKDDDGCVGRECPIGVCQGYFKIKPGTGVKGKDLPCHCPYCGHTASHNQFWTKDQIEFAKSVALRQITNDLYDEFKKLEFEIKPPPGSFGIGISMRLERGEPLPLKRYRERTLETHVCCSNCSLDYSVYGVFAFCPDCGTHNSFQILERNANLARKQLSLAEAQSDDDFKRYLVEDALENCVSAFDGFGREACRVRVSSSRNVGKATNMSFQNLQRVAENLSAVFGIDMKKAVSDTDWNFANVAFMRRHVIAHNGGVIDRDTSTRQVSPIAFEVAA